MTILPLLFAASLEIPATTLASPPGPPAPPPPHPHHVFIETDPATFLFSGFAGHLRWRPAALPHWTFGAGVYAMNLPSIYTKLAAENRGEGWSLRARLGTAVFVDRYLRDTADGPFVGVEAGTQTLEASRGGSAARFTTLLVLPRFGYLYRPFDNGFYVMPWLGAGVTTHVAGHTDAAGETYRIFPFIAFATLHVGWRL